MNRGHHEGMSTDDEENNSIIAKYKLEIGMDFTSVAETYST